VETLRVGFAANGIRQGSPIRSGARRRVLPGAIWSCVVVVAAGVVDYAKYQRITGVAPEHRLGGRLMRVRMADDQHVSSMLVDIQRHHLILLSVVMPPQVTPLLHFVRSVRGN